MEAINAHESEAMYRHAAGKLPSFTLAEPNVGMGASLGNSALWIHTKGTGAIERVFLNEVAESLAGAVMLRYGAHARPLAGSAHTSATYMAVYPALGSRVFDIHPAYQRMSFQIASVLDVRETTFLPLGPLEEEDEPVVYIHVEMYNRDEIAHHVRVVGSATLRGTTEPDVRAEYNEHARGLVAYNAGRPELVRIFALSEHPTRYGSDFDFGGTYDAQHLDALRGTTDHQGDVIGRLQLDLTLKPKERREFTFRLALYACERAEAVRRFANIADPEDALRRTIAHLEDVVHRGRVLTPDPVINFGALWSKVNMRRVMAAYPTGRAFTNDPGKYANVVVRDCAWFIYGNDHFMPSFSRTLLDNIASRQYPSGKLPEYFDGVTGRVEDDGLNINDDTPLFILAVNHHFRATGDMEWLKSRYAAVERAARYIISQVDHRDLVYCSTDDPRGDVWGIAGWRNIIPGYRISGAVTEINAECVAALRAASHLADNVGDRPQDKGEFVEWADRIRKAMDAHLINPDNGLYYLNIDTHGNPRTDVTGDQVFPLIMRTCSDETAYRIISRLNCPDFWTSAGLRTVSRFDPRYDPAAYSGLLGGVWPGLTWWYAFGAARYQPELMVRALRSSFEHYGAQPRQYNTVPGQFSEWFDGESLANRGMRLSPWEPPRFLWAAIEGVCGMMLTPEAPRINPLIPPKWSWAGVSCVPYHGSYLSYFLVREGEEGFRLYSTADVQCDWHVALYDTDVSGDVRVYADTVMVIALTRNNDLAILAGNTGNQTVHSPIAIRELRAAAPQYRLRVYNSERRAWDPVKKLTLSQLQGFALSIEAGGFRVIELSPA